MQWQRDQYKFNLSTINKLINMQQNVQSQKLMQAADYSQQRNSNPSKIPDSEIIRDHHSATSFQQTPIQLQIHEPQQEQSHEQEDKLKQIDQQIQKEKQLIEKLKLEKEQIQNSMNKSFLSLSPNLLHTQNNDESVNGNDDLLETKTQADLSFLQNRKNIATKELETEEEKYRENIRKMQLKKNEIKRKLKEDQQIPIKIMDFKELQKKKDTIQDEQQNLENSKSTNKDLLNQKQSFKNQEQQEKIEQIDQVMIETESKKPTSDKLESSKNDVQKSLKSKQQNLNNQPDRSQKQSQLINKSKFTEVKSQSKVEEANVHENKSRISELNSQKKYSVKKSSVIIPESNQSIKEIQERRERHSQRVSSQKQSHHEINQEIDLSSEQSKKSRSRVSSVKKSEAQDSIHSQKDSDHNQKQKSSFKDEKSFHQSVKSKKINQEAEKYSNNEKEKSVRSEQIENQLKEASVKQKSISIKSKKSEKVQLMYVPHAPKSPSHKSFKKTDKSIQWSEVDMSMYGKTNEVPHSHNNSQLLSELNRQNHPLKEETEVAKVSNLIEMNQVNMKKNKTADKILVEEGQRDKKNSEKVSNLAPLKSNKEKSERESIHSKNSHIKRDFFSCSREGSVKEKAERYDQFHRQHSLNNKKIQNKKLVMIENLNGTSGNKQPSYRSRKSNPISKLSASRSKTQTVVVHEQKSNPKEGKTEIARQQTSELNESKVLISKHEINLLHTQIQKLEEKLLNIEAKQQILAKEKQDELVKLQEIVVEEEKLVEEIQKSQIMTENQQNEEIQNLLVIPQQESLSRQLVENEPPVQLNMNQSKLQENKEEQNNIKKQIDQIAQIQQRFNQEKSELLEEINRLKKTIRELQIEKIKSIDHKETITSKDDKPKRPDTEINEFGVIVHQNKNHRTIDPFMIGDHEESAIQVGKIYKNQSPEKNGSHLIENLDLRAKSIDKKFRINISKKSSILSQNIIDKQFDSADFSEKAINNMATDEQRNQQLQRKRKESYPINAKDGYVVVSPQKQSREQQYTNQLDSHLKPEKKEIKLPDISQSKIRRAELMKEEILEKFHRTNREFNNFIQSSRIINETNSSISSQNNFFFDKTHHSSAFSNKKVSNQEEEINPETTKFLNKMSDSNLELHKDSSRVEFQQNFTKIVQNIKNQGTDENESDDELQEFDVRDIQMPELSKTPDIRYDQNQLMKLAQETFKLFGIEVNYEDSDFSMKKYKNCVIFTKGTEKILWHYNGKFYIGGWKGKEDGSGEKTGYGIEIVPDKHIYKGQFMNGKKHGTGIIKSTNGNIYDGQWIEGIKNGQGVYYDSTTKVVYSGEWKDGKKHGFGLLKFSEKEYYKGTFVKSVKDGFGIEVFINGDKYKGEYRKGKFQGKGKYTWANTSVFEGDFYEGMRHGNGSWKSAKINGDIYVGAYLNDKKSGYGRYIWSNGCIYEGNFAEDVKHGKGRLIYTDGKQIKGIWQEGTLLEAVTQNPKEYNQEQILKRGSKTKVK